VDFNCKCKSYNCYPKSPDSAQLTQPLQGLAGKLLDFWLSLRLAGQNFEGLPKTKTAGEFGPSTVMQKVAKFLSGTPFDSSDLLWTSPRSLTMQQN